MDGYKFAAIYFVISVRYYIYFVSALRVESINGGIYAQPQQFTYQVGVVGRVNFTSDLEFLCGGGIIAEHLVLSAAQCFMNADGSLREYRFYTYADKLNWRHSAGIERDVYLLYFPSSSDLDLNDICILELDTDFGISHNARLSMLSLPFYGETFQHQQGSVSGYGDDFLMCEYSYEDGMELEDANLRYGHVLITDNLDCHAFELLESTNSLMCGRMIVEDPDTVREVCYKDGGDPLVINHKVVGLVSRGPEDCRNYKLGSVYTNVSNFVDFLNAIIDEEPLNETITYFNRPHVLNLVAPAA